MTDAAPFPPAGPPGALTETSADAPAPAQRSRLAGFSGARADLRSALYTVAALALAGLGAGGLWIWLAPRADYRVTSTGVESIGAAPSSELFMSDDGVFVLILAGLGLLAGIAVWSIRRHRGPLLLLALATGMLVAGVLTWQLGEWAGPAPTKAQLADVGARVTTALSLGATAALAVGPFVAVLVYLIAASMSRRDDLGGAPLPGDPLTEADPLRPPLPPVPPPVSRA